MVTPAEPEVQWWTSLTSSPKRGSFCLSSLDPTQLSHFCQTHSTEARVHLSTLIRPDLAGALQVLSHMDLQNLKAEVDPSLEPGSDQRASENMQGCSGLGNTWRLSCTSTQHQMTQSSYQQQRGPSRAILEHVSENHQSICQRLHG